MADPTVTSHHGIIPHADEGATVNITLDGREITVAAGQFLIAAAEDAGVFIPRFCYHPRLKPVGMCRMCLVEVSGPRGATLQPACYVPVAEGMTVDTTSEKVHKAQDGVLEFLLVNHPLDCPVCDKGGECPLQDQTLAYGPGESRFIEEKRHFAKPIALSPLVLLDRERCIQCGRCTRFAAEIAGEAMIDFAGRGDMIEVAIADGHVFSSAFSGNTVQICPVGALTSTPYRFTARPWDLDQVESTCTTCSVGCRAAVQSSANRVTRLLGIDCDPVNQSWLCDKGRYGYEAVNSQARLTAPTIKSEAVKSEAGTTGPASWSQALQVAGKRLAEIKAASGADSIGVIGGARLANEDAYAWAKLAKGVIGTDSVDCQIGDGLPAELVLGLPRATIDETCGASCVVVLAGDLYEEVPVLYLRLRSAAEDNGLAIVELTPRSTHLSAQSAATIPVSPGTAPEVARALATGTRPSGVPAAAWEAATASIAAAGDGGEGLVVVVGRPSLAESSDVAAEAVTVLADAYPAARFLPVLRRGNVFGALDMGLAPGVLPGRVGLTEGRDWYLAEPGWADVPSGTGHDTEGILRSLADGSMKAVVLLGADPIGDFPDVELATKALDAAEFVLAVDCVNTPSVERAHVVLPAAMHHERAGTTTNIEGRVLRVGQKLTAPVGCWPDWMIASELAARLGGDLGAGSVADLWDEIERLCPSHVGLTRSVLDSPAARDGVVVPLKAARVTIGRRGTNWESKIDPMATPGIESVELQGAVARVGAAESQGSYEPDADEQAHAERPKRPSMLTLASISGASPAGSASAGSASDGSTDTVAEPEADSLRLVAPRRLYDHGVLLLESESLSELVRPLVARVNPAEISPRGLTSGSTVRIESNGSALEVELIVDAAVEAGTVEMSANVRAGDGGTVASLIKAGSTVTDVKLVQK